MPARGQTSARASGGQQRPRKKVARKKSRTAKASSRAAEQEGAAAAAAVEQLQNIRANSMRLCLSCRLKKRWAEKPTQCDLCELRSFTIELLGAVHSQSRDFTPEQQHATTMLDTHTDPAHIRKMMKLVNRGARLLGDEAIDAAARAFTEGRS